MNRIQENTFAAACYNTSSIDELQSALSSDADLIDMKNWRITADEWRTQIRLALNAKLAHSSDE